MSKHFNLFTLLLISALPRCDASLHSIEPVKEAGDHLRELVVVEKDPTHIRTIPNRREVTNTELFDHLTDLLGSFSETSDCLTSVTYLKGTSNLRPTSYLLTSFTGISSKELRSLHRVFLEQFSEYREEQDRGKGTLIKLAFRGNTLTSDPEIPFTLTLKESALTDEEKSTLLSTDDSFGSLTLHLHFLKGSYRFSHARETLDLLATNPDFDHIYLRRLEPFALSGTLSHYKATFSYDLRSTSHSLDGDDEDNDENPVKINPLPTFDVYLYPTS